MVIFYVYLCYFTKKSRLYRTEDTQIEKNRGANKKPSHTVLCVSVYRICIFSKEITALLYDTYMLVPVFILCPFINGLYPFINGDFYMPVFKHDICLQFGNVCWIPNFAQCPFING